MVVSMGFSLTYALWAGFLLLLVFIFRFFMKDAPYFQYEEMGIETDKETLLRACGEELFPSGTATASIKRAASDWRTWILTIFYFVSFGGFIALTVWFPTYWGEHFGLTLVHAGFLGGLYSLSASILRVFGGFTSDSVGGEKTVCSSFMVMIGGSILMMVASQSTAMAITGKLVLALGMGFANAAVFKLIPKYTPEAVGGAAGIVGGFGALGGFVMPPLMGLWVKLSGDKGYSLSFSVFLVLSLLSLVLFAILHRYSRESTEISPQNRNKD
jgi:NNP family nitrate/nitrite transporter-like MFS transporter